MRAQVGQNFVVERIHIYMFAGATLLVLPTTLCMQDDWHVAMANTTQCWHTYKLDLAICLLLFPYSQAVRVYRF